MAIPIGYLNFATFPEPSRYPGTATPFANTPATVVTTPDVLILRIAQLFVSPRYAFPVESKTI